MPPQTISVAKIQVSTPSMDSPSETALVTSSATKAPIRPTKLDRMCTFLSMIALRIVIALWGALAGFALGASLGGDDSGILTTAFSWILGIVLALIHENPKLAEAYVTLGTIYRAAGLSSRAEAEFRRALELSPGHPQAAAELHSLRAAKGHSSHS